MKKDTKKMDSELKNAAEGHLEGIGAVEGANMGNAADEAANKLMVENNELKSDLQRIRADFENYRKQVEVQKENEKKAAKFATVYRILPLLDDIDRGIAAYDELKPLAKTLDKSLKELELVKIKSESGTEFNPDLHDAVMFEDGEGEKEVVVETLRPGYYYGGEVLRPAMVKVKRV